MVACIQCSNQINWECHKWKNFIGQSCWKFVPEGIRKESRYFHHEKYSTERFNGVWLVFHLICLPRSLGNRWLTMIPKYIVKEMEEKFNYYRACITKRYHHKMPAYKVSFWEIPFLTRPLKWLLKLSETNRQLTIDLIRFQHTIIMTNIE